MKRLFPIAFFLLLVVTAMQFSCTSPSVKDEYKLTLTFKPGEEVKIVYLGMEKSE